MKNENPKPVQEVPEQGVSTPAPRPVSRRQLLVVGSSVAAAAVLGRHGRAGEAWRTGLPYIRPKTPAAPQGVAFVPFWEPPVVSSQNGVLSHKLNVEGKEKEVLSCTGNAFKDVARSYNGLRLGPTFKMRRGDLMELKLINKLPKDKCNPDNFDNCCTSDVVTPSCCTVPFDHNRPHCFNTTNLHTHGLHVSPAAFLDNNGELIASDEVLLEIKPGEIQKYCIQLPDFHAPGSYWYHAHKHGSVAIQLSSGNALCGGLIIEEDDDERILKEDQPDRIWLIQEQMGAQASLCYSCLPPSFVSAFTVNGLFQPTLKVRPGRVERWRFINATATPRGFGQIQLLDAANNPVPMHLIAVDGITFYDKAPQPKTTWQLAPGGRADFLVQFPPIGAFSFFNVRKAADPQVLASVDQDLAFVVPFGPPVNDTLPTKLPKRPDRTCYLKPIFNAVLKPDVVDFGAAGSVCGGASCLEIPQVFTIQGQPFDPNVVNHTAPLGAVQEWQLANNLGSLHPFHIHLNPFQVIGEKVDTDPMAPNDPTNWMWRDVVSVSPAGVNINTRFLTYDGKYVLHCHILNHEDLGMMQVVQAGNTIYDPETGARLAGDGVGPCQKVTDCVL